MKRQNENVESIGGLVGKAINCKITESSVSGRITVNGIEGCNIGGIVGKGVNTEISEVTSDVDIQSLKDDEFDELKKILSENIKDIIEAKEAIKLVEEMQKNKKSKDYKQLYVSFISIMSDHITLIGPFIPFLTKFIGK